MPAADPAVAPPPATEAAPEGPGADDVVGRRGRSAALAARGRWLLAGLGQSPLLTVPVMCLVGGAWAHRWNHEDGFITFRVVQQIVAGNGPVFNAGERVEAFTSPLWLGMLTVLEITLGWVVDLAWLSVFACLGLSTGGLVLAMRGAQHLRRGTPGPVVWLPAGALVFAAVPSVWDWSTGGLENGLAFGWLGLSFWWLARRAADASPVTWRPAARSAPVPARWLVVLGLGVLIRPEMAVYSAAFALVLLATTPLTWGGRVRAVLWMGALPLAYQVFRMGYFGALVPNTALAKSAGAARWGTGLYYVVDYVWDWRLVPALGALVVLSVASTRRTDWHTGRLLSAALVAAGIVHTLYLVRLGGDYMFGRFLTIPTFAVVAPASVVAFELRRERRAAQAAALLVLAVWAVAVVGFTRQSALRPSETFAGAFDQREQFVALSGRRHLVTADDYRRTLFWVLSEQVRLREQEGNDELYVMYGDSQGRQGYFLPREEGAGLSIYYGAIGIVSVRASTDLDVRDPFSLADPIGSRLEIIGRNVPGHERWLSMPWAEAEAGVLPTHRSAEGDVAARVLRCGDIRTLLEATREPMSPSRFVRNMAASLRLTRLHIPRDPLRAEDRFC